MVKPNGMLQVYPTETYVPKNHYARNSQNLNPYQPNQNLVVNPYTQVQNPQNIVVNPYSKSENPNYNNKYAPNVKTPYPEFDCSVRKNWSNNKKENDDKIEDCVKCLQNAEPEDRAFYCDGMCTSEYALNKGQCSYNSLVASNIKECINPCQQKIPDSRHRETKNEKRKRGLRALEDNSDGCKDNSDCAKDQECVIKNVIGEDGTVRTNVGVCEEKNPLYNPDKEKKSFNIMNILNDCTSDDWRLCIADISVLKEQEIKQLIENKVKDSKDNKTFDEDKDKIVNFLKKIKNDPELIKNGYDIVDNTISKLNYIIKEINSQYDLNIKEKGENLDTNEIKSEYIIDEIKTDKNLKDKLQSIFPTTKEEKSSNSLVPNIPDDKKDLFIKVGAGVIIFLIIVLIFLLIFYRKGGTDKPVYKSIY